jgi:hypothetical protein
MMKFLAMRAISLCWEFGTMNLSFWEITEIIIKCGRQICRHLSCPSRLQMDPKQSPSMSTFSSLTGSLINAIEAEPIIAKWKSRAWSSDIYGHYWNNVWWMRWFKWSCERPIPRMCWINTVPLYNISGKWHELKYVANRILKICHEILGGLIYLNYKYATYKSHTE